MGECAKTELDWLINVGLMEAQEHRHTHRMRYIYISSGSSHVDFLRGGVVVAVRNLDDISEVLSKSTL